MAIKARQTITIAIERNVSSSVPYYQRNSTQPNKPDDGTTPSGMVSAGWSTTEPSYSSSNSNPVWVTFYTTFSDGTTTCSAVSRYSSYDAAITAYNTATAADKIHIGTSAPTDTTKIWYDSDAKLFKKYTTEGSTSSWTAISDFSESLSNLDTTLGKRITDEESNRLNLANLIEAVNTTVFGKSTIVSATAPTSAEDKTKLWVDVNTLRLKKWSTADSAWVEVTPGSSIMAKQESHDMDIYNLKEANKRVLSFTDEDKLLAFKRLWDGNGETNTESVIETTRRMNQTFTFGSNGLEITSSENSTSRLLLTNENIQIIHNNEVKSEWDGNGFKCPTVTTNEIKLKRDEDQFSFNFVHNTDGSVSFRKEVISGGGS